MAKTKGCRVNKTNEPIQTSKDHERDIRCSNCNKLFDVMKADVGLPTTPNTLTGLPDHNNPWVKCPHCDFVMTSHA